MIRKLKEKDIDRVIFLEETFLTESIGKEMLQDSLNTPHLYFYVYELKDLVIGYIGACILADQTEILNFVIDEAFQRNGYGQLLLNKIIEESINLNSTNIVLEVNVSNQKGINFYLKNNFKNIHTRKNYYKDGSDAYLMKKEL